MPTSTAAYSLLGIGVTSGKIDYGAETSDETYINEDSGTTEVEGYKPKMDVEQTAINGDATFEFIDSLRKARAILDDAHTDIVNVWLYETATAGAYPAEKQNVSIEISDFGGDGGKAAKINYVIHYTGDPVQGTFNPTTLAFTAS
jgi:hypothetical protein